jgi:hypothetical protein
MTGQADVARRSAVTVEDGRDLVAPTHPTRGALAELGTRFGVDADLGHDGTLLKM